MTHSFFEDEFVRDDNTDIANGWTGGGDLQIINQAVRQSTGGSVTANPSLTRTVASAGDEIGSEYAVQAVLTCDDDASNQSGSILLRYDTSTDDGYAVRMLWSDASGSEALTVQIRKIVAGSSTTLATIDATGFANTASSSYDSVFQNLTAAIRDEDEDVRIEVKLNDEADPILSYVDKSYPQFRASSSFGISFEDEAGVAGHVFLNSIAIQGIQETQGDYSITPAYWTFGRILQQAKTEATRNSNSQIDDEAFKNWINAGMQEMFEKSNRPHWGNDIITVKVKASTQDYELPPEVYYWDDIFYDTVGQYGVDIVDAAQFRRWNTSTSSGTPYEAYPIGTGPNGGTIMRFYPTPSEARTYTIRVAKTPRYLTDDDQIPDVPQNLCHWLSWAAVMRYSGRDSDRTHIRFAGQMWDSGLKEARKQSRRRGSSSKFQIRTGLGRRNRNDFERSRYGLNG